MGCGSSKGVQVAPAPTARQVVSVKGSSDESTTPVKPVKTVAVKASPDSGVEEPEYVTEDSKGAQKIVDEGRPPTPDLCIQGHSPEPKSVGGGNKPKSVSVDETNNPAGSKRPPLQQQSSNNNHHQHHKEESKKQQDDDDDDDSLRGPSATSIRSAPVVLERPASRGGSAFELSFEDENKEKNNMPRRLDSLQRRHSSRKKKELTLDELQAKLEAAEHRRKEYEQRLKDKMSEESKKAEIIQSSPGKALQRANSIGEKTEKKEKQAEDNREQHLKLLRDRLKEKEEKAKQVRERKRTIAASSGPASPS